MRKKILIIAGVVITAVILAVIVYGGGNKVDSFTVKVLCESNDIYQIFYTCYFDGESYGMGGMADYDENEITSKSPLEVVFTKSYLDDNDISKFSLDFSPYGENDINEIGTTNRVDISAEYGKIYTVVLRGDKDNGFTAELQKLD